MTERSTEQRTTRPGPARKPAETPARPPLAERDVVGEESASEFDIENYLGTSRVLGFTMLIAAIDVVLLTAVATLTAFLYNMSAALLGGIDVTLAEDN